MLSFLCVLISLVDRNCSGLCISCTYSCFFFCLFHKTTATTRQLYNASHCMIFIISLFHLVINFYRSAITVAGTYVIRSTRSLRKKALIMHTTTLRLNCPGHGLWEPSCQPASRSSDMSLSTMSDCHIMLSIIYYWPFPWNI